MSNAFLTAFSLDWHPALPWLWIAGLALILAVVVIAGYLLRAKGVILRGLLFAVLLLMLCNPTIIQEKRKSEADIVLLIVDRSASQTISPRPEQLAELLPSMKRSLSELGQTEVRFVDFGDREFEQGSRAFLAIETALADVPSDRLSAVIMVSDGQTHDDQENRQALESTLSRKFNAPFYLLLTGKSEETDRKLTLEAAPLYGLVGEEVEVRLSVEDSLATQTGLVELSVRQGNAEVEKRLIRLGEETTLALSLNHAGENHFEFSVATRDDELTEVNNKALLTINGVRERLRVLLVSGQPHQAGRTWRNFLKSDSSVELVHFTILRPSDRRDDTPSREMSLIPFPVYDLFQERLSEFDLIVFDLYPLRRLLAPNYFDNIVEFVKQGGALMVASGNAFASPASIFNTSLRQILPGRPTGIVYEQAFKPKLSDLGKNHPVTGSLTAAVGDEDPDWGPWYRQIGIEPSGGSVLMTGVEDQPLLVLDQVGKGRVAQLVSDQVWLWARGHEGGGPHAEFLRRLSHWLMKEPELEAEQLKAVGRGDRLLIERMTVSTPTNVSVTVTTPEGQKLKAALERTETGSWKGELSGLTSGLYELAHGDQTAYAALGLSNNVEFGDAVSRQENFLPLVEASGGKVFRLQDNPIPDVRKVAFSRRLHGSDWMGVRANAVHRPLGQVRVSLFPSLIALMLLIGLMLFAWLREGR